MASNSSKRLKPATPEKGVDKCAVSGCVLSESSPAIQCDECDKWLCATCLGMSTAEYNIFCKMNERLGSIWTCPLCKTGSSKPDVPNIVKSTLESHCSEMRDMFAGFRSDMQISLDTVRVQVETLETAIQSKVSIDDVQKLVENSITTRLETDVRKIVRQEQDRNRRRLNLIAYGVPLQTNDVQFVIQHLASDYGLPGVKILNLKRLGANKPPTQQVPDRPPPILFSVTDIATKVKILKKSVELKADIQFHSDESREDRAKRKSATEELKRRIANGETDLGVRNGKVVSKNGQRAPPPALGAMEH